MMVFDGHCDTILRCYQNGGGFRKNGGHLDLERMKRYGGWAQFFACFGEQSETPGKPLWQVFQEQVSIFRRQMEENADLIVHCRTAQEVEQARGEGRMAAFLSAEGAELLDCDLQKLELAYGWGLRAVNITWNHENVLSGTNAENPGKGLTEQGKAFVTRMQELGMLVDVSHLSDPGFWDVMALAKKPVFASHSNARALCAHKRNLTDAQFTAIIEHNGVAGLNLYADFLGVHADLDAALAHLEHWLDLGGAGSIALGGDLDGCSRLPEGIRGVQDWDRLWDRLLQRNYSEALLRALFFENLMRVVSEVCTM